MLFPCGMFLWLSHPHQDTHTHTQRPSEQQKRSVFSLKVKAAFIHSLGNNEFDVLVLDVPIASVSLLPQR